MARTEGTGARAAALPARMSRCALITVAAIGSTVMAAMSWRSAAVPVAWQKSGPAAYVAFYLGLALLIGCWLELGRRVLCSTGNDAAPDGGPASHRLTGDRVTDGAPDGDRSISTRLDSVMIRRFVLAAGLPFLAAAPFGRDLWAYAAQGNLVRHGIDPYAYGPSALPGPFADQVSPRWVDSSSPYGPLWLQLSHGADVLAGQHITIAALLLRLPAFAGVLLWMWGLPRLAAHFEGRAAAAGWLGLAGPLTIVLGLGGGHNDLLMVGLVVAGLAVTCGPGLRALVLGAAVLGLAVMVKSPAAIAVVFTVPIWLHANRLTPRPRRVITASAIVIVTTLAVTAALTMACGLGIGWAGQVNADAQWVSWLSLPSAAAMFGKLVVGDLSHLKAVDGAMRVMRTIGEALTAAVVALLWLLGLRRAPLTCLTVAFGATALLAPSVQPWYYCWALALAGLVVHRQRLIIALAAVSITFPVLITPSGVGLESNPAAVPILAGTAVLAWFALRAATGSAPKHDGADDPGAEVRADDSTEFRDVQLPDLRHFGA
jgi:alpha-1,6-mannosyltransferase